MEKQSILKDRISQLKAGNLFWVESVKEFINCAQECAKIARAENSGHLLSQMAKKVGSKYFLKDHRIEFSLWPSYNALAASAGAASATKLSDRILAFGQSKYYSDNLSENVKRGIRQKLRRGEWPGLAPFGYVNNPKTRTIEPDQMKARVIKKAFEEYAQGRHTLESLGQRLSFWGVVSGTGKPLCKATLQRMLTNKVYLGLIVHNGETYEGCFPAIVSRATFEKVQEVLKNRAKPRHSKKRHYFPFTGLLTCGECGAAITAQWAHGNGGTYRYYRCTKRLGSCSQRYLREDLLVEQLKDKISKVALCEDWKEKMLAKVEMWEKENIQSSQSFAQNLEKEIKETEQKLDKLVNAFLDGSIEKETYLAKKDELIKTKTDLNKRKADFGRKGNNWIEPLKEWILSAHHAEKLASSNDFDEIKSFAEKIGTNRRLLDRKLIFDFVRSFDFVPKYTEKCESRQGGINSAPAAGGASEPTNCPQNSQCLDWSTLLKKVRTFFKSKR
jgi:hypothetical protein